MRRVVWSDPAIDDLAEIRAYLEQFNPVAATRVARRLIESGNSLAELAERGRPLLDGRELSAIWPYVILYRIEADTVQIVRVRHGARLRD